VADSTPDLPPEDRERVDRLAERLGFAFSDRARALAALTHKSFVNEHRDVSGEDNERLEFLGDAVIDLLASVHLVERFPAAREGELSKLRAAVVDETGLAAIGRALGLGELLRLGRGEEITGGREKASLLADATEAVIAAVFLDGGLAAAQGVVARFLDEAYARGVEGSLDRDYKTQLQEVGQARHRSSPRYRVVGESGPDHAKIFEIEVEVRGVALGRGTGRSKKDAEQGAARAALAALAAGTVVVPLPAPASSPPAAPPDPRPASPPAQVAPAPPPLEPGREAVAAVGGHVAAPDLAPPTGPSAVAAPLPVAEPEQAQRPAGKASRSRKSPGTRKERPARKGAPHRSPKAKTPRKKGAPRARKIAEPRGRR
jgi:ribonuclease-3